ncbi:sulfatase-like hydrolase/transferase [Parahaliea mediterranea]|uniref:sulfatase-like hydrolase/transferase n=1 Tax=Parahaliea mediterranea TaxID=651086 RepID=UPI000E2F0F0D|nr:sulfatase-like hydrolase/transferase [Parahaliea mediterranea]
MTQALSLRYFLVANYLLVLAITTWIARDALLGALPAALFALLVLATYSLLYLLPTIAISALAWRLHHLAGRVCAVVLASATVLLLLADSRIHAMYGFHINGFVWNLLTTPGGIASMGGSASAEITAALLCLAVVLLQAGLMLTLGRRAPARRWPWGRIAALVLCVMVIERIAYGLSHLTAYRPVLAAAREVPFYRPTTFRTFAARLGYEMQRRSEMRVADGGRLLYPRAPIEFDKNAPTPNIVWLVGESLRWDMLDPTIMPNAWRFAAKGRRYTNHFSGGNGTRMGMFSLFYGLPGNYWSSFLDARQPPMLITTLQQQNYQFGLYTSAKFSYPEFDKTLFASLPASTMTSDDQGKGWQRDRRNVTRLLDFVEQRDASRPFFAFMFFESSHAQYYFPPESVLRPDYLRDFNYATVDVQANIDGIFARYVNASHHLDSQLGRVFDYLESSGLLDNTIVVMTGDHGEEFLEEGRWGHNSAFHNEQLHVPLVLYAPGLAPGVFDHPTSHLDVVPTLMPRLGVRNPRRDYALGMSLDEVPDERYRLAANWDALAYIGKDHKVVMPLKASGVLDTVVEEADDDAVANDDQVLAGLSSELAAVLEDLAHFYRRRANAS